MEGRTALFVVFAATCLIYSFCAITYTIPFYDSSFTEFHAVIGDWVSGTDVFSNDGSASRVQWDAYFKDRYAMSVHTICGGLILSMGLLQLIPQFRRKELAWIHRWNGRTYAVLHVANLVGSGIFLLHNTLDTSDTEYRTNIYAETIFALGLVFYWLGGFLSLTSGVLFARMRQIQRHYQCMLMNYAIVFGAPGLRLGWLGFAILGHDYTMEQTNNASMVLLIFAILGSAPTFANDTNNQRGLTLSETMSPSTPLVLSYGLTCAIATKFLWIFAQGWCFSLFSLSPDHAVYYDEQRAKESLLVTVLLLCSGLCGIFSSLLAPYFYFSHYTYGHCSGLLGSWYIGTTTVALLGSLPSARVMESAVAGQQTDYYLAEYLPVAFVCRWLFQLGTAILAQRRSKSSTSPNQINGTKPSSPSWEWAVYSLACALVDVVTVCTWLLMNAVSELSLEIHFGLAVLLGVYSMFGVFALVVWRTTSLETAYKPLEE